MTTKLYGDYLRHWLRAKEKLVKPSTYANYSLKILNHIIPALGHMPLKQVDSKIVQEATFNWLEKGSCAGGGGLKLKTVKDLVTLIRGTLKDAAKQNLRENRPIEIAYPRSTLKPTCDVLESKNQHKLIKYISNHPTPHNLGLLVALYTGMRIGEICALQWKNIDLEEKLIYVDKTLSRIFGKDSNGLPYNKIVISSPKTARSQRSIPLAKDLYLILQKYAVEQPEAYLLTGSLGYSEPSNYRHYYYKLLDHLGIGRLNFHGLRHTFASRLIEKGADYKIVSELLGHASVNMTLNIYVHSNLGQKRKAVERLNMS